MHVCILASMSVHSVSAQRSTIKAQRTQLGHQARPLVWYTRMCTHTLAMADCSGLRGQTDTIQSSVAVRFNRPKMMIMKQDLIVGNQQTAMCLNSKEPRDADQCFGPCDLCVRRMGMIRPRQLYWTFHIT